MVMMAAPGNWVAGAVGMASMTSRLAVPAANYARPWLRALVVKSSSSFSAVCRAPSATFDCALIQVRTWVEAAWGAEQRMVWSA